MSADDPRPAGEAQDWLSCRHPMGCQAPGEGCIGPCPVTPAEALEIEAAIAQIAAASGGATDGERGWTLEDARRIVASIPPPTVEQEQSAALDYAETALSECWAILRRIADGDPNPRQLAADLLDAHGFHR